MKIYGVPIVSLFQGSVALVGLSVALWVLFHVTQGVRANRRDGINGPSEMVGKIQMRNAFYRVRKQLYILSSALIVWIWRAQHPDVPVMFTGTTISLFMSLISIESTVNDLLSIDDRRQVEEMLKGEEQRKKEKTA